MKMKKIFSIISLLALMMMTVGCDDFLGDNVNPDAPTKVPIEQIMPTLLFYSALQNFDHGEYGVYMSQCLTTLGRSQTGSYAYRSGWYFMGMNRHPQWRRHFFDIGTNVNEVLEAGAAKDAKNYIALARLIRLMSTLYTTDVFGDMPLTEAYTVNNTPKYDSQESIYAWMEQECDDLLAYFAQPEVNDPVFPMSVKIDRVFGGDMAKWKQVLLAQKARLMLRRLPNLDPSSAAEILETAELALVNWTDPNYKFDGGTSVEKNCMWGKANKPINSWESRTNDLDGAVPSKFFMKTMLGFDETTDKASDPRLRHLMKKRADDKGVVKYRFLENNIGADATQKKEHFPDLYHNIVQCNDKGTICLFTKEELHFIAAEAAFWAGNKGAVVNHVRQGIESHMRRIMVAREPENADKLTAEQITQAIEADRQAIEQEIADFLGNPSLVPGEANIKLQYIMKQKYIAMYLQPEQWNDMRRYGYSNDGNGLQYNNEVIYPTLRRPYNLYVAHFPLSNPNEWVNRLNYDPETEEKYNVNELIRLGAYKNPEWLKKPMIWSPKN